MTRDEHIYDQIDEIDASVFSGDAFWGDKLREYFKDRLRAWTKEIESIEKSKKELEEEEKG